MDLKKIDELFLYTTIILITIIQFSHIIYLLHYDLILWFL